MEKMIREILETVRNHDKKMDVFDSKMDEQSRMLRALLEANEVRKAQVDAHDVRLAKVEGTIKGQANLAVKELGNV